MYLPPSKQLRISIFVCFRWRTSWHGKEVNTQVIQLSSPDLANPPRITRHTSHTVRRIASISKTSRDGLDATIAENFITGQQSVHILDKIRRNTQINLSLDAHTEMHADNVVRPVQSRGGHIPLCFVTTCDNGVFSGGVFMHLSIFFPALFVDIKLL
jgi:hypothetical protein